METTARRDGVLSGPVRSSRLRVLTIGMVAALMLMFVPASPAHAADSRRPAEIRDRIEYLVNRARARHGLRRLRVSLRIQYYAKDHARTMAASGTIFHDVSGLYRESLVGATAWGENVATTSATDAALRSHRMFMSSSGHRANILRPRWTHMGIGVAKRNGSTYIVQRFADAN